MGLHARVGRLHLLLATRDPALARTVAATWLRPSELDRGLRALEPVVLAEAGFFDAIRRIAKTHGDDADAAAACPKGKKMVFGVCRDPDGDKAPKDFFAAAALIAQGDHDAAAAEPKKKPKHRDPRRGEDDSHMPAAWHRKRAAHHAKQAEAHKDKAAQSWAGDPRSAAHHVIRSIEHDVRSQHHTQAAELSPQERQRARDASTPPAPD